MKRYLREPYEGALREIDELECGQSAVLRRPTGHMRAGFMGAVASMIEIASGHKHRNRQRKKFKRKLDKATGNITVTRLEFTLADYLADVKKGF
jgi:hypothetical protein